MPKGYSLPIETRKEIKVLYEKGLGPTEISRKLKLPTRTVERYNKLSGDLELKKKGTKPGKKLTTGEITGKTINKTVIAIGQARRRFDEIMQGSRVKLAYKQNKRLKVKIEPRTYIVIQKTPNFVTVAEIGKEYNRSCVNMADILTGEVKFECAK